MIGGIERRHAVQSIGDDPGNAHNGAAMIVEFEGRADLRVFQLGKFRVVHHEKCVVGIDVLNIALFQCRAGQTGFRRPARPH